MNSALLNTIISQFFPRRLISRRLTQDDTVNFWPIWYLNLDEVTLEPVLLITMLYSFNAKIYHDLRYVVNVLCVNKLCKILREKLFPSY